MSFLIDQIGVVKQGERLFCRACRKLMREGSVYRCKQEPKPFRREHDFVYTHHPKCPRVICLIGSTRFTREMLLKQWELAKQGHIVLGWCVVPMDLPEGEERSHLAEAEGVKDILDGVHFRKIDMADEVLVVNVHGYIGESTHKELLYAWSQHKPVHYMYKRDPEVRPKGETMLQKVIDESGAKSR